MRSLIAFLLLGASLATLGVAPSASADACPPAGANVPVGLGEVGFSVNEDCTVEAWAFRGINCIGPWPIHYEKKVGPVHAEAWACGLPGGGPASPTSGPCQELSGAGIEVGPDCRVVVSVDLVDCTWREVWREVSAGPLTVRYTQCDDGGT